MFQSHICVGIIGNVPSHICVGIIGNVPITYLCWYNRKCSITYLCWYNRKCSITYLCWYNRKCSITYLCWYIGKCSITYLCWYIGNVPSHICVGIFSGANNCHNSPCEQNRFGIMQLSEMFNQTFSLVYFQMWTSATTVPVNRSVRTPLVATAACVTKDFPSMQTKALVKVRLSTVWKLAVSVTLSA